MIAYIIASEIVYLWQHYSIVSFIGTLAGLSVLIGMFIAQDVRREKRRGRGSLPDLYLSSSPGRYSEQLPRKTTQEGVSLRHKKYSTEKRQEKHLPVKRGVW